MDYLPSALVLEVGARCPCGPITFAQRLRRRESRIPDSLATRERRSPWWSLGGTRRRRAVRAIAGRRCCRADADGGPLSIGVTYRRGHGAHGARSRLRNRRPNHASRPATLV